MVDPLCCIAGTNTNTVKQYTPIKKKNRLHLLVTALEHRKLRNNTLQRYGKKLDNQLFCILA